MRVVTSSEMKQIEQNSLNFGLSFHRLMENAGSAAAAFIKRTFKVNQRNCVIFCSRGNNGGDGFVVARKLSENDVNVLTVMLGGRPASGEALAMCEQLSGMGVPIMDFDQVEDKLAGWLAQTDLVVDAICGTGFKGQLREIHKKACALINDSAAVIVSLDIPTGVECDSGLVADGAVRADYTLVFDSLKLCHILDDSLPFCGAVEVLDIGIPDEARNRIELSFGASLSDKQVFELIPQRPLDSHKGTFGRVLNIAGSGRYRGAAILSALAALRCGAGLVTLASTETVCASASSSVLEATFLPLAESSAGTIDSYASLNSLVEALQSADAVAFGCGLENNLHTSRLLELVLKNASGPIVLDAYGINALAENIHLLKDARAPVILTPHPGEMARLCKTQTADIQANRASVAFSFARKHGVYLLLKGQGTLIASPDGGLLRNETGNPGLAKGGSGDVLTGMIAALLAQGLNPRDAAACGAFLHGMAADRTALRRSQTAMLPGELLDDLAGIFLEYGR